MPYAKGKMSYPSKQVKQAGKSMKKTKPNAKKSAKRK